MRIGDLSTATGVPVATIKYYQREGLVPAGERLQANQVRYGPPHVARIRLIRALSQIADLSIASIRQIVQVIDGPGADVHELLGTAQGALPLTGAADEGEPDAAALTAISEVAGARGWSASPSHPVVRAASSVLSAWRGFSHEDPAVLLPSYCEAADRIADADMAYLGAHERTDDLMQMAVVGTAFGDALIAAFRRLAHEAASARRFGEGADRVAGQRSSRRGRRP